MAITDRLRTASIRRETEGDDGYGGLVETEAELLDNVLAEIWPITPTDRHMLMQKFGAEVDRAAALFEGTLHDGDDAASSVQRNDIIRFSSTERFQILGLHKIRGRTGNVGWYSVLVMEAPEEA